jgi:hypothetical protein
VIYVHTAVRINLLESYVGSESDMRNSLGTLLHPGIGLGLELLETNIYQPE